MDFSKLFKNGARTSEFVLSVVGLFGGMFAVSELGAPADTVTQVAVPIIATYTGSRTVVKAAAAFQAAREAGRTLRGGIEGEE